MSCNIHRSVSTSLLGRGVPTIYGCGEVKDSLNLDLRHDVNKIGSIGSRGLYIMWNQFSALLEY